MKKTLENSEQARDLRMQSAADLLCFVVGID